MTRQTGFHTSTVVTGSCEVPIRCSSFMKAAPGNKPLCPGQAHCFGQLRVASYKLLSIFPPLFFYSQLSKGLHDISTSAYEQHLSDILAVQLVATAPTNSICLMTCLCRWLLPHKGVITATPIFSMCS